MAVNSHSQENLPTVITLHLPEFLQIFKVQLFQRFRISNASLSALSLYWFLASNSAQLARAMLRPAEHRISGDNLRRLPSLKLIDTTSAWVNHIDLSFCRQQGIAMATAGNVFADDVADMAVGLLIDVVEKISAAERYGRKGNWAALGDFPLGSKI